MVFLHIQSASLYTIKLFQVNIYTFDHILILTKSLAEKPPPQTDTWWQVSKSVISIRVPEGLTGIYFVSNKSEL